MRPSLVGFAPPTLRCKCQHNAARTRIATVPTASKNTIPPQPIGIRPLPQKGHKSARTLMGFPHPLQWIIPGRTSNCDGAMKGGGVGIAVVLESFAWHRAQTTCPSQRNACSSRPIVSSQFEQRSGWSLRLMAVSSGNVITFPQRMSRTQRTAMALARPAWRGISPFLAAGNAVIQV